MFTRQLLGDEVARYFGRTYAEGARGHGDRSEIELYDSDSLAEDALAIVHWFGIEEATEFESNAPPNRNVDAEHNLSESQNKENSVITVAQVIDFLLRHPNFELERIARIAVTKVTPFNDPDDIPTDYRIREKANWTQLYDVLTRLLQIHQRKPIDKSDWETLGQTNPPTLQLIFDLAENAQHAQVEN